MIKNRSRYDDDCSLIISLTGEIRVFFALYEGVCDMLSRNHGICRWAPYFTSRWIFCLPAGMFGLQPIFAEIYLLCVCSYRVSPRPVSVMTTVAVFCLPTFCEFVNFCRVRICSQWHHASLIDRTYLPIFVRYVGMRWEMLSKERVVDWNGYCYDSPNCTCRFAPERIAECVIQFCMFGLYVPIILL